MKKIEYLIVGGSAAGTTAAETIRDHLPNASICIVNEEPHEQYSRVLIPHYLRHKVEREQVFLKKPEWYLQRKIELLKGVRVKSLELGSNLVVLANGEQIEYGKLLIAVGGNVAKLTADGSGLVNILYMRTIEDADLIIRSAKQAKRGVIIGGGFIGLEFTSSFKLNGVADITILVREPFYWSEKLDEASSKVLTAVLERNGIKILTNEEANEFLGWDRVEAVVTKSGKKLEADVVGVGVGIKSDLEWVKEAGVEVNRGVITNEYLETNVANVYAAGDCAEFWDVVFETKHVLGNWANATYQGNIAAKNMVGEKTVFETASSYSINFFDGSCSFVGVTDSEYADEIIARGSVTEGKMTRIFIKTIGGVMRVVGATVINNTADVAPLTVAIKNRVDISLKKDRLSDSDFSLGELNS